MDYKRVLKNVAFIVLVPSVVVVGYYGYKALKNRKGKTNDSEDSENLSKDETVVEVAEKKEEVSESENKPETNVIPIFHFHNLPFKSTIPNRLSKR